jgi:hypothetical protein
VDHKETFAPLMVKRMLHKMLPYAPFLCLYELPVLPLTLLPERVVALHAL